MPEGNKNKLLSSLFKRLEEEPLKIVEAKKRGVKVVGYFCPHVPEELIIAAGMHPVRLAFGGNSEPVSDGEQFLKPYCCPFLRSCLGYKIESTNFYYDTLDAICVAYTCIGMRRVQEYWERYFDIPSFVVGIPRTHDRFRSRPQAKEYFKNELMLLKKRLEEFGGQEIKNRQIIKAIKLCNSIRDELRILFEYPQSYSSPIRWYDVLRISHAGFLINRTDYLHELEKIEESLRNMDLQEMPHDTRPRLMICGSIIGIGDYKLLDMIEQAGGNIVADSVCTGSLLSRKNVTIYGIMGDPIDALAERYLYNVPCPFMVDQEKRINRIIKKIRDYKASALIYYNLKNCDIWRSDYNVIKKALQTSQFWIPILLIEAEYSPSDVGTIRTKVEAFIETIGGKVWTR
jgi:benzoyl-CoA reductase/2-hydroxyglutaryl-CoA dehydratase subunit BcrC/BadD/HgdB